MRTQGDVFHLAIPVRDLDETVAFYLDGLGVRLGRRYADRVTFDFFGDQLVCHLAPESVAGEVKPYPRHFGVTFREEADYQWLLRLVEQRKLPTLGPPSRRFSGSPEEHFTV